MRGPHTVEGRNGQIDDVAQKGRIFLVFGVRVSAGNAEKWLRFRETL